MAFFKSRASTSSPAESNKDDAQSMDSLRKQARHRLIGATVLVVIAVVGFPLVFDTKPRDMAADIRIDMPDRDAVRPSQPPSVAIPDELVNAKVPLSEAVSGNEQDAFRGKRPIFKAILEQQGPGQVVDYQGGVSVAQIKDDPTPVRRVMDPGNPVADKDGYVYTSNVNEMGEMVDMMAASRSYQNNVEVINTARQLMMRTLEITKA